MQTPVNMEPGPAQDLDDDRTSGGLIPPRDLEYTKYLICIMHMARMRAKIKVKPKLYAYPVLVKCDTGQVRWGNQNAGKMAG